MFGFGKKKKEEKTKGESLALWTLVQGVLLFVEEDSNRTKSFLRAMCDDKNPKKETISAVRTDLQRAAAWTSEAINEIRGGK